MEITGSVLLDNLLNLANVLYLLSYTVRDMLRLRLFTIIAASCLVVFFWRQPEPLWPAILWNMFFIVLNLVWTIRLVRRRWVESGGDSQTTITSARRLRDFVLPTATTPMVGRHRAAMLQSIRSRESHDAFWFVAF